MTDHTDDSSLPKIEHSTQIKQIRDLNDRFRKFQIGGTAIATPSIMDMGAHALHQIMQEVADFDAFTEDNDPYGEHDFGSFEFCGETVFWKFDYYDLDYSMRSLDPSDLTITARMLTVMLGDEY